MILVALACLMGGLLLERASQAEAFEVAALRAVGCSCLLFALYQLLCLAAASE